MENAILKIEDGLDKLAVGSISPSRFTKTYIENVNQKLEIFYQKLGITIRFIAKNKYRVKIWI